MGNAEYLVILRFESPAHLIYFRNIADRTLNYIHISAMQPENVGHTFAEITSVHNKHIISWFCYICCCNLHGKCTTSSNCKGLTVGGEPDFPHFLECLTEFFDELLIGMAQCRLCHFR